MAKKSSFNCRRVYRIMEVIYDGNMAKETIKEDEITQLLQTVREVFLSQPMLLELEPPINVCGDIHGQYDDLKRLFDKGGWPPEKNYLFLGDYVDRGPQGLETIVFLLSLKYLFPENFFLLRGNHESDVVNKIYGFLDECKCRYSVKLWKEFVNVFDVMPVAAIIGDKIFCCHGGISPELVDAKTLSALETAKRPCKIPDKGLLCDLLWADPTDIDDDGFIESDRGVSYTFGKDMLKKFLDNFDFDLLCRAHQVVDTGYEFFGDQKGLTVFSAPNYCGEFDNAAALLVINEDLMCQFEVLLPDDEVSHVPSRLSDRLQYGGLVVPELPPDRSGLDSAANVSSNYHKVVGTYGSRASPTDLNANSKSETYHSNNMTAQPSFHQSSGSLVRMDVASRPRMVDYPSLRGPAFEHYNNSQTPMYLHMRGISPSPSQKPQVSSSIPLAVPDRPNLAILSRSMPSASSYLTMPPNLQASRPFAPPREGSLPRYVQMTSHMAPQKIMIHPRGPNVPTGPPPFLMAPPRHMAHYGSLNSPLMPLDRLPNANDSVGSSRAPVLNSQSVPYHSLGTLPRFSSPLSPTAASSSSQSPSQNFDDKRFSQQCSSSQQPAVEENLQFSKSMPSTASAPRGQTNATESNENLRNKKKNAKSSKKADKELKKQKRA